MIHRPNDPRDSRSNKICVRSTDAGYGTAMTRRVMRYIAGVLGSIVLAACLSACSNNPTPTNTNHSGQGSGTQSGDATTTTTPNGD
jgi:hypothetical protein